MNNFALDSIKIKSSWFDGEVNSKFQKMGKEEGLNLYLQLFRFRVHQGDITKHFFITSVSELQKFTKVNIKKKLSPKKIAEILEQFDKLGIIKNHSFKDWSSLYDGKGKNGKVITDKLLKLEATDVPQLYKDEDGTERDITPDDKYLHISFKLVDYIYYEKCLSSKALAIFFLIRKWSNNSKHEKKAWMNINTFKERLGFSNETVTLLLIELNMTGLIATSVKREKKRDSFEHWAWFDKWGYPVSEHRTVYKDTIDIFLKRYNNSPLLKTAKEKHEWDHGEERAFQSSVVEDDFYPYDETKNYFPSVAETAANSDLTEPNPFEDDEEDKSNSWGLSPNGYGIDEEAM